jgi:hypothetical protein
MYVNARSARPRCRGAEHVQQVWASQHAATTGRCVRMQLPQRRLDGAWGCAPVEGCAWRVCLEARIASSQCQAYISRPTVQRATWPCRVRWREGDCLWPCRWVVRPVYCVCLDCCAALSLSCRRQQTWEAGPMRSRQGSVVADVMCARAPGSQSPGDGGACTCRRDAAARRF